MSRSGLGQNACAERPAAEPRPLRENSSFETGRKKATKAGFTPDALRNFCQKDFFLAVHHSFLTLSSLEFAEICIKFKKSFFPNYTKIQN